MIVCVKAITVRFHLDHPAEKRAWEKLNTFRKERHQSFSQLVTDAVNDYDTDRRHFSDTERNRLVREITEAVSIRLQQILPAFLAGYSAGASTPVAAIVTPIHNELLEPATPLRNPELDDAIPDFGDSCMDFDFIGV